jgi:hypothetical protein
MIMRRQVYAAIGFPILLLGLLAAERIATFLLGMHPSSTALWAASMELRSLCRVISNWLELVAGGSLVLQVMVIVAIAAAICLCAVTRRGAAVSFVVNHGTLLLFGAATMLANGADFASSDPTIIAPLSFIPLHGLHVGWLHGAVFAMGVLGCLSCHAAYLAQARRKERVVADRLRELALGLADRRSA